jgi:hypothetical protein
MTAAVLRVVLVYGGQSCHYIYIYIFFFFFSFMREFYIVDEVQSKFLTIILDGGCKGQCFLTKLDSFKNFKGLIGLVVFCLTFHVFTGVGYSFKHGQQPRV